MTHKHDPIARDLVKTLSFASVHFTVAFSVGYLLTGSAMIATGLALVEPAVNTVAFFFHERAWKWVDRMRAARQGAALGGPDRMRMA